MDDLISLLSFALTIGIKVGRLETMIDSKISTLTGDQLIRLVSLFRSAKIQYANKYDVSLKYTHYLMKSDAQSIEIYSNILTAMKLFSRNVEFVSNLDQKILRLSEQLNVKNWIDLLITKSILRQRDVNILEAAAHQLIALDKEQNKLTLDNVQQALLSCGILSFMDEKFEKHLIGCLSNALKKPDLLKKKSETETLLGSIINSIGMLQIRDTRTLNTLAKYLMDNFGQSQKLLTSFVITCGHLNYNPNTAEFKQMIKKLNTTTHPMTEKKDKIMFLNYVWSTCLLKCPNTTFMATVLDEQKFYGELLHGTLNLFFSIINTQIRSKLYFLFAFKELNLKSILL